MAKQKPTADALTPSQLKKLQETLPSSSPYSPGKSPFVNNKKAKREVNSINV